MRSNRCTWRYRSLGGWVADSGRSEFTRWQWRLRYSRRTHASTRAAQSRPRNSVDRASGACDSGFVRSHAVLLPQVPLLRFLQHHAQGRSGWSALSICCCGKRSNGLGRDRPAAPRTIFFGGGTPIVVADRTDAAADRRAAHVSISRSVDEWTVEANPATVTLEYLPDAARERRRSAELRRKASTATSWRLLERHHDPDECPRSIEVAQEAGFTRLNVDLIYAIPGQDLESWARSLEAAIALRDAPSLMLWADVRTEHADRGEEAAGAFPAGER